MTIKTKQFLVQGDHPIFRRIDDRCTNLKEAKLLIKELQYFQYDNIKLNGKEITENVK